MFNFFNSILDILQTVLSLAISLFFQLLWLFKQIPAALSYLLTAVGYVPIISSVLVFVIVLSVILQLINHGG